MSDLPDAIIAPVGADGSFDKRRHGWRVVAVTRRRADHFRYRVKSTLSAVPDPQRAGGEFSKVREALTDLLLELNRTLRQFERLDIPDEYRVEIDSLMHSTSGPRRSGDGRAEDGGCPVAQQRIATLYRSAAQFRNRLFRARSFAADLVVSDARLRPLLAAMTAVLDRVNTVMEVIAACRPAAAPHVPVVTVIPMHALHAAIEP